MTILDEPALRPAPDSPAAAAATPAAQAVAPAAEAGAAAAQAGAARGRARLRPGSVRVLLGTTDAVVVAALLLGAPAHRPAVAAYGVVLAAALAVAGLYRPRLRLSVLDDLPALATAALVALGLTAVGAVVAGGDTDAGLLAALAAVALAVAAGRCLAYAAVRTARRAGLLAAPTLIVGCGGLAAQLSGVLATREYGLSPVGFVDDDPRLPADARPLDVVGRLADLPALVRLLDIEAVVIGWSNAPENLVVDVVRGCHGLDVEIYAVPRYWQVHSSHRLVEVLRGVPLVRMRRPTYRSPAWRLKRVLDVVVASLALVVAGPVMLACAVAVRIEGGPGVIFRQERVGLDGRHFEVLKLRSLKPATSTESATRWNVKHDDRLGPVGKWLRRLSLDELPQLWNILRGDMSLVGPRPERPFFVAQFGREHDDYLWRHRVPCGLTGWAQVSGLRGDTSISDRARFDNYYIENWSLWLDVKIVLRTVRQVVVAAGG